MPANLKDLRGRIKSVKNTQQITKAMKLVSSAKFGRAQQAVVQARPYAKGLSKTTSELLATVQGLKSANVSHPLMSENDSKVALVFVFSSERGLCGGYNANLAKQAVKTIEELEASGFSCSVVCFGKKAFQVLSKKRLALLQTRIIALDDLLASDLPISDSNELKLVSTSFEKPTYSMVSRLSKKVESLFANGKLGKFVCVYSKFISALAQEPVGEVFLPVAKPAKADSVSHSSVEESERQAKFEPDVESLMEAVLPRYLAVQVFQSFLESVASEHGARMTAMDNATRNAKDMEKKLQITYQRARQAAITRELIEIISGAEAV